MRIWILFTLSLLFPIQDIRAQTADTSLPCGFEVGIFANGFNAPTTIAFAPDGRLFVAEKEGAIRIVSPDGSTSTLLTRVDVYAQSECGLIGMALDPDFSVNHYIYVFATVSSDTQQIIRITEADGVALDRTVIRDNLPTSGQVHNGGGLRVGPDDKLYFAIGDTGVRELSQQLTSFAGKICRINLDGSTPDDNPFVTPTGTPRAIYALGFRNPFRFCFAPDGRLLVMDVGSNGDVRREEINMVHPGENYGWPEVEGFSESVPAGNYVDPIIAYDAEGSAITGCAFYDGDQFPDNYYGDLFHLDFTSHKLFRAKLGDESVDRYELFYQAADGPVDLTVGPDGALYFTEFYNGSVKQIRYGPAPPDAVDPGDGNQNDNATDAGPPTTEDNTPTNTLDAPTLPAAAPCGAGTMLATCLMLAGLITLRCVHTDPRRTRGYPQSP